MELRNLSTIGICQQVVEGHDEVGSIGSGWTAIAPVVSTELELSTHPGVVAKGFFGRPIEKELGLCERTHGCRFDEGATYVTHAHHGPI